ncbi:PRD domain-containing protein [uncultured Traorella sp.]|uniref:PRD domain-containing protein n=1 Tax=uncultured Traorella sp. TaxID=1929048 RepID=UPI0025D6909A|nr:PRD domain-containing protein [uncultured Traorella sp.]
MKVIRNINNNVALCIDSKGKEVIVFGKGIGFSKVPCEIPLNKIERTFYDLDNQYISLLNDLSSESLKIADIVVNYAIEKLNCELNSNLIFNIADHIDFAIERYRKNIKMSLSIFNDIEHLYDAEMEVGKYALDVIYNVARVRLPEEEAACIALNIINSEYNLHKNDLMNEKTIDQVVSIIEETFKIKINKKTFSYSRFVTHMYYLFKRENEKKEISSDNLKLYNSLIKTYPKSYECANEISKYFKKTRNYELSKEESLYLILHINRLCSMK